MITMKKLNELPGKIKNDVLDYAEYLVSKYKAGEKKDGPIKWADVSTRLSSVGESATDTILRNRENERW